MSASLSKKGIMTLVVMNGIAFVGAFAASGLNVALPSILEGYGMDSTTGQIIATVYGLFNGICMLLSPTVYARFNTRRTVLFCTMLNCLGIGLAAIAANFAMLLLARLLCGCAIGLYMPGIFLIFNNTVPQEQRGKVLGIINTIIAAPPIIAVLCSGWLIDNLGWHTIFLISLPFALALIPLAWKYVDNYNDSTESIFELRSFLFVAIGCAMLLCSLTVLPQYDYSHWLFLIISMGIVLIYLFARRQKRLSTPFINLSVLRVKGFRTVFILAVVNSAISTCGTVFVPIIFYQKFQINNIELAMLLMPATIFSALLPGLIGHFLDKDNSRHRLIFTALLCVIISCLLFVIGIDASVTMLCLFYAIFTAGVKSFALTADLITANILPKPMLTHGTCIYNSVEKIASAIGTASVSAFYGIFLADDIAQQLPHIAEQALFGIIGVIALFMIIYYLANATKLKQRV